MAVTTAQAPSAAQSGYAPVNGLQFGELLPSLAATRQVIAADLQGHGRTGDHDRPLTCADLASDVVGLLQHLDVPRADVFGFSVGGGVAPSTAASPAGPTTSAASPRRP